MLIKYELHPNYMYDIFFDIRGYRKLIVLNDETSLQTLQR